MTKDVTADRHAPGGEGHPGRRRRMETRGNPRNATDFIMVLEGRIAHHGHHVHLAYVPDKLLLAAESFEAYLAAFDADAAATIERLAFDVLDDINNEIVPRWVQVVLTTPHSGTAAQPQRVIVEDRQPNWDNPHIMAHRRML